MANWIMFGILTGLSVYDLKYKKVNVIVVAVVALIVLFYRIYIGISVQELFYGLLPGAVLLLIAYGTRESVGVGDGLVLCLLGLFSGGKQAIAVLGMALMICAVLAMILLAGNRVGKKTALPFLPCLCAGYLIFLLC